MEPKFLDQIDEIIVDLCRLLSTARRGDHGEVKTLSKYLAKLLTRRAELRSLCGYDVNEKAMDLVDKTIAKIFEHVSEIYSTDDFAIAKNLMEILIARAKLGRE